MALVGRYELDGVVVDTAGSVDAELRGLTVVRLDGYGISSYRTTGCYAT